MVFNEGKRIFIPLGLYNDIYRNDKFCTKDLCVTHGNTFENYCMKSLSITGNIIFFFNFTLVTFRRVNIYFLAR